MYLLTSFAALTSLSAPVLAQDAPVAVPAVAAPVIAAPAVKQDVTAQPPADIANNPEHMLNLDLSTGGRVVIQLRPDIAPAHVERVKSLTRAGFYNGIVFHRVIEGFMAQTGDPTGTGTGGSQLPDMQPEFSVFPHLRGTVSMARAATPESANSQFFVVFQPRFQLDRSYTSFGRVVSGMQYIDAVRRGEPPVAPSRIVQASIAADNRPVPPVLTEAPLPQAAPITADDLNAPLSPQ